MGNDIAQMSNEPRPVYASELELLGMDKYWHFDNQDARPYLWAEANNYIYRGIKFARAKGGSLSEDPVLEILYNKADDAEQRLIIAAEMLRRSRLRCCGVPRCAATR